MRISWLKLDNDNKSFTLKMEKPQDEDSSITKYTYEIYKAEDLTDGEILNAKPVYTFSSDTLKEQKLKLGENNLEDKTDYCFKMIVEYNDK